MLSCSLSFAISRHVSSRANTEDEGGKQGRSERGNLGSPAPGHRSGCLGFSGSSATALSLPGEQVSCMGQRRGAASHSLSCSLERSRFSKKKAVSATCGSCLYVLPALAQWLHSCFQKQSESPFSKLLYRIFTSCCATSASISLCRMCVFDMMCERSIRTIILCHGSSESESPFFSPGSSPSSAQCLNERCADKV